MVWIIRAKDSKGDTVFWAATEGACEWRVNPYHNIATFHTAEAVRSTLAYLSEDGYCWSRITDVQAVNLSAYPIG